MNILEPTLWYWPDGRPVKKEEMEKFDRAFSSAEERIVGQTRMWWGGLVSTVWLGVNHAFGGGRPVLFETMVFGWPTPSDYEMVRYHTKEEARVGHAKMVRRWQNPLRVAVAFLVECKERFRNRLRSL